uniref:Uncharacterized protein n=1 Tax=viral metagenome TaxID=1070528 RepID=A0A6C0F0D5_9ZZZZ
MAMANANARKFQDPSGPYQTTRQRTPSPKLQTPSMSGSMNSQGFPFVYEYDGRYSPPPPLPFGFPHDFSDGNLSPPYYLPMYSPPGFSVPGFSPPASPYFHNQNMMFHANPIPNSYHDIDMRMPVNPDYYNPDMNKTYVQSVQPKPVSIISESPKAREPVKLKDLREAPKAPVSVSREEQMFKSLKELLEIIELNVESHDAYIFGDYVIKSIIGNDLRKKFYEFMRQKKFEANQIETLFFDKKVMKTLANRLDLPTEIDIFSSRQQYDKFLKKIKAICRDSSIYKMEDLSRCHDIMKLSKFKDTLNMEAGRTISLLSFRITVSDQALVLNLYVSTNGPSTIPLGFFTEEEKYMIYNGKDKYILYYPGAFEANNNSDHNIDYIIAKIIDTPSNRTIMFGIDYDVVLPKLSKDITKVTEPQTYDFKTSATTSTHFTITNGHIMKPCSKCRVPFVKNSLYAVTKCCREGYHFDCLLQNYLEQNRQVSFNCSKDGCTTHNTRDVGSKNVEILMILSGLLY